MDLVTGEIFGPIAAIQTFASENEVIDKANTMTMAGRLLFLSGRRPSYACCRSTGVRHCLSNSGVFSTEVAPFELEAIGIGSEGGAEGIADFLETKFHSMGGIDR